MDRNICKDLEPFKQSCFFLGSCYTFRRTNSKFYVEGADLSQFFTVSGTFDAEDAGYRTFEIQGSDCFLKVESPRFSLFVHGKISLSGAFTKKLIKSCKSNLLTANMAITVENG